MMILKISSGVVLAVAFLWGCSTASKLQSVYGTKYRYSYALQSPSPKSRMSFQDEWMKIQFRIDQGAIRFRLQNRSKEPLNVVWDKVSLGVNGRYHTVRNSRTLYLDNPTDLSIPTVLPNGYIIDMAIPSENVYFDGNEWKERDLLPTTDRGSEEMRRRILGNKGSKVTMLMPIRFGTSVRDYLFEFRVTSVDTLEWEKYRSPRRPLPPLPPGPSRPKETGTSQIVTALVVAGVVGVSAILLTQKKTAPSE